MLENIVDSFIKSDIKPNKPLTNEPIQTQTFSQTEIMQVVHKQFTNDTIKNILFSIKYKEKIINLIKDRIYLELYEDMTIYYRNVDLAVNEYLLRNKI